MKPAQILLTAALALSLTACAVGPAYRRPAVPVTQNWSGEPSRGTSPALEPAVEEWWKSFRDPELESLITRAVSANLDLQIAAARIAEARAARGLARSDAFPQVTAGASVTRSRQIVPAGFSPGAGAPAPALVPFESNFYQGRFDMAWEADVFGRVRSEVRAATADVEAQQEDRRNLLITLLGDVATNYAQLRGYDLRLRIANGNIAIQQQILDLTRELTRAGQATERDVAQAEVVLEVTRSVVPQLETGRKMSIHRLGVLLGAEPNALDQELSARGELPPVPASVPVGLPSDLLKRRPDIRRAEAQLVAATARIGEAKADFFPRFSLTGSAGRESTQLHLLSLGGGNLFSFGPSVSLPVFTAGRIRSNVAVQEERAKQAAAAYQSSVLRALEETRNALVSYANEQERRDRLDNAIRSGRTALELAQTQYRAGLADFLTVLDAERTVADNEDQLAQSQTAMVTNLVALYKALGGGWPAFE
ncbi:MAG TPA: efflux transporter outer membrane subunit [Bryobacteraceae bacterium]|nr:efflux transporter outer membrane subunit [Bryobacteraceae bacterium]